MCKTCNCGKCKYVNSCVLVIGIINLIAAKRLQLSKGKTPPWFHVVYLVNPTLIIDSNLCIVLVEDRGLWRHCHASQDKTNLGQM